MNQNAIDSDLTSAVALCSTVDVAGSSVEDKPVLQQGSCSPGWTLAGAAAWQEVQAEGSDQQG